MALYMKEERMYIYLFEPFYMPTYDIFYTYQFFT